MEVQWRDYLDDYDNTFYEADSPYTDGEDGPAFQWRLRPFLLEDRKKRGQCSVRQARILSMKGLDPNMSAQKAGWYFDRGVMRWKSKRRVA